MSTHRLVVASSRKDLMSFQLSPTTPPRRHGVSSQPTIQPRFSILSDPTCGVAVHCRCQGQYLCNFRYHQSQLAMFYPTTGVHEEHHQSAFLASSRTPGDIVAFFSMSAAHNAAPTVFVKAKTRFANGIISRRKAATPKAVYAPRCSSTCISRCLLFHSLS